jgi:hypothetical protein
MKEFKGKTTAGKLKTRGLFKANLFAFAMGVSINFGRIYRFLEQNGGFLNDLLPFFDKFLTHIFYSLFLSRNTGHERYSPRIIFKYSTIEDFINM